MAWNVLRQLNRFRLRIWCYRPDWYITLQSYREHFGVYPRVFHPTTFNEKIVHRKLFDRRPLLTQLADKAGVRSYVEARLGGQVLTELYHLTTDPTTIPFDQLPARFVVKPTHASGWIHIVWDKSMLNRTELIETCQRWLKQSFYRQTREWAYKDIQPQILVEEFIDDGSGTTPMDYKFYVFEGVVKLIQVDSGRFHDHRRRHFFPPWEKTDVLMKYPDMEGSVPEPEHLIEMIAAAETLGRGLDFIRTDFYDTPRGIYFGELTNTPENGRASFTPPDFDHVLGSYWKLPV